MNIKWIHALISENNYSWYAITSKRMYCNRILTVKRLSKSFIIRKDAGFPRLGKNKSTKNPVVRPFSVHSEYSSVSKHLILATLRDWTSLKKYGNLNIFRPEYIFFSICQLLWYSYVFLQIHFPNIFIQVEMLTILYLEDRFFFLNKYVIAIKSEETGVKIEPKDAVSLATKILRYLPNFKTSQKLEKASTVLTFSPPLYSEALLCNYVYSHRQVKYSLK